MGLRLIAPDRPGYGLSDPMPGRGLADWSADIAELLDHLGIGAAPILAISGGGPYAVATVAHLGARITALGLVSPLGEVGGVAALGHLNRAQRAFFLGLPLRFPKLLRRSAEAGRAAFLAAPGMSFATFRAALSPADRQALSTLEARQVVIDMTREAIGHGLEGALSDMDIFARPWAVDPEALRCPARVWQGTADRIVPEALALDLARRIPGAELTRLESHGHFWVIAHVDEVLGWIARHA